MSGDEAQAAFDAMAASLPPAVDDPSLRTCSQCLLQVPRATYDEHMQGHGYVTLHVGPPTPGWRRSQGKPNG